MIRFSPFAVAALALLLLEQNGMAQTEITPPARSVPSTVKVADGDLGGKFFGTAPDPAKVRHYYIAAEPELWDFAPEGVDVVCGKALPPPLSAQRKTSKLRYIQYTGATFAAKVMQPPSLGILGPVLRGVVGETLAVTFLNRTARAFHAPARYEIRQGQRGRLLRAEAGTRRGGRPRRDVYVCLAPRRGLRPARG